MFESYFTASWRFMTMNLIWTFISNDDPALPVLVTGNRPMLLRTTYVSESLAHNPILLN